MSVTPKTTLIETGVDWLTMTVAGDDDSRALHAKVLEIAHGEFQDGFYERSFGMSGYKGFTVGAVDFGTRADGAIARLRSVIARRHWLELYAMAASVSRLDLQNTVRVRGNVSELVETTFNEVRAWWAGATNKPEPKMIVGANGAQTVMIGKRVSEVYGRGYDKGVESGEAYYESCFRQEVEYKGTAAKVAAATLCQKDRVELAISHYVQTYFVAHGCRPIVKYKGSRFFCPKRNTDKRRRLAWIEASVGPTALAMYQAGEFPLFLRALGFAVDVQHVTMVQPQIFTTMEELSESCRFTE